MRANEKRIDCVGTHDLENTIRYQMIREAELTWKIDVLCDLLLAAKKMIEVPASSTLAMDLMDRIDAALK